MHYFNWNIKSYVAATVHLSNSEDLAYRRLLDHYYDTELPIPTALPVVCRRLRLDLPDVEMVLNEFFILRDDGWHNQYCDDEISKYKAFITRQKENGSKGGRGNKSDAKPNKPTALENEPNAKPTKNKEQETNKPSTKEKIAPEGDFFEGIDPQIVSDFKSLRTKHRAPITKTAMNGIKREAAIAGFSFEDALKMCCERNWRGFKADWVKKDVSQKEPKFDPTAYVNRNRNKPDDNIIDIN